MYNQYKLYIKNIAHILLVHAKNKEKKKLNKEMDKVKNIILMEI